MSKKGRARLAPRKGGLDKAQNAAMKKKDKKKQGAKQAPSKKKHNFKRKAEAALAAQGDSEAGLIPHGYTDVMKTLLVGEGNFSFARALVRLFNGNGFSLTATAYDSEEVVNQKYEDAKDIVQEVKDAGSTVLYGIDAGDLVTALKLAKKKRKNDGLLAHEDKFDRIVFNFPHAGLGIKDQDVNVRKNQELLARFFVSANDLVREGGEVHVALKQGKPYSLWNTVGIAHRYTAGMLKQKTELRFDCDAFPGYAHRRTLGYKEGMSAKWSEEVIGQSRTFVFVRLPAGLPA